MRQAIGVWVLLFALLLIGLGQGSRSDDARVKQTFGEFLVALEHDQVRSVELRTSDNSLRVERADGRESTVGYPPKFADELVGQLRSADVRFDVKPRGRGIAATLLRIAVPVALIALFVLVVVRRRSGSGAGSAFRRAPARRPSSDAPAASFRDVAGADEAVEELREITSFLREPQRYEGLGARIPKGVLLYGPPGTGKTLLARAVAGEAGVPFFSISGSDFVEMFVGVGASRVRDLFEQAKQNSPCIIFMDEIDAVGRHRGAGLGGGHDEREQTLNQLLVEMDGFEAKDNIIMIAATNRPDILDPALLRPGRFDRQITVDRPDRQGRRKILEVHTRGKPLASDVDLDVVAAQSAGLTGADLANVVNEAALLAARADRPDMSPAELQEALMRVVAGPERRSRVLSERERRVIAVHELGHAIVGHCLPRADPVHKVSIIARGQALGSTIALPAEDTLLVTEAKLSDTMAMTLGGRAAEEIVFGEITTSASDDLEKVTSLARQMVTRFGMTQRLGPRVFGRGRGQPFLGREYRAGPDYSPATAAAIDDEIARVVGAAYRRAEQVLLEQREALDVLSLLLLEREAIERDELEALLAGTRDDDVVAGVHATTI